MNLFSGKEWRHRCRECLLDTVREEESGINGESGKYIYISIYLYIYRQVASIYIYIVYRIIRCNCKIVVGKKFLCSTGNPVWCSLMTWRDGMEEERGHREGGDVYTIMADLH